MRDIHNAFGERIAYTTLMTTLDRLYRKRLLDRKKDGRAFMYTAAVSRQEFEHEIREDMIDGLLDSGTEPAAPVLACFVDAVSDRDRELLDELDRLVKEKKRDWYASVNGPAMFNAPSRDRKGFGPSGIN